MRESQIETYLVKRVKQIGGEVRKVKWIGRRGAPDRLVMLPTAACKRGNQIVASPALTVWVELKSTGVKAAAYQLREHSRMRKMGQYVVVIDSIESVEALLT